MYQAAIVEDEAQVRSYLQSSLISAFHERSIQMGFDSFAGGEGFLSMVQEHFHYDVIFLDIEMPGLDGISICKRVREIAPDALVVFISNKEELVFQTFEVQPFRFIRKSEYDKQLPALADAIARKLQELHPQILRITEAASGDIYSFDIKKILYVEAQRKYCRIVTTTDEVLIRCKLMDLEAKLPKDMFLKPHRSYLVNCMFIYYIGKTALVLTTHEEIALSRNKIEEVKAQFLAYTVQ